MPGWACAKSAPGKDIASRTLRIQNLYRTNERIDGWFYSYTVFLKSATTKALKSNALRTPSGRAARLGRDCRTDFRSPGGAGPRRRSPFCEGRFGHWG